MLARDHTLKGAKNFAEIERKGRVFQAGTFGLAHLKREDAGDSLFGFVVSSRVSPDAVNRNRIKRALSEAVRQSLKEIKEGYNVVFLVKQAATKTATDALMREVKAALSQAGLMKK